MDCVDVLCRLIEFDTSGAGAGGCRQAFAYLDGLFVQCNCDTTVVSIPPTEADGLEGRMALVAHRRAPDRPRLIIYGHIDVVPAEGWAAFTPRRVNDRIFGRGASDMKGAIASLVWALWRIRALSSAFDVTVLLTMDEETHQMSQLRYLTPFLDAGLRPHVLSLDGGCGYVSIAILGLLQMDITAVGRSVHSGLAHLGHNAVEGAVELMHALKPLQEQVRRRRSVIPASPATGLPYMEGRFNINRVDGGIARNVVPDRCTFMIDRRLLPDEAVDAARDEILAALREVPGVEWHVSREFSIPSVPPCADPLALELAEIQTLVSGSTGLYGDMLSGELPCAARRFWGGDAFATGLIRPENSVHGVDEFVYASDLQRLAEVLARFLTVDQKEAA